MSGKNWVGRSGFFFFFFFQPKQQIHILAVIMLRQHTFCVFKGKRKLKLLITFENFVVFFSVLTVFILLCKYLFRKCGKKLTVGGFCRGSVGLQ